MSGAKKFVPIFERFPAHYRRFLEDMKRKPAAVHYKPPPDKYVRNPVTNEIWRTEERAIPVLYPRECQEGIWGGEGIIMGYMRRPYVRYVKYFYPSLKRVILYSEILDKYMRVTVTERTLILINEHCGFDLYILKTPVQDLHSQLALDLRRKMLLALARKDLYPDNKDKQKEILEKYKEFIVSEEEADWFGLTLWKAERKYLPNDSVSKYSKQANEQDSCDENHAGLGSVDSTISDESYKEFERWQKHDDSQDNFCEMDDEASAGMEYVDLSLNPERYTGYAGASAHRIWRSIYEENCFKPNVGYGPYTTSKNLNAMCLEKRAFYRAVSGLHTSINVHLCAQYLSRESGPLGRATWGPNAGEFQRRFSPSSTRGEGPQWLRNLYFVYLLELGALAKAAPYLLQEEFYTSAEDESVRNGVRALLDAARDFPHHFNDSAMFNGRKDAAKLKEEFKVHFRNISKIMDCVGCDKCRLWGKLQVQGLGTAFKILFTDKSRLPPENPKFHLSRSEIVSLFNAFGRLSNSIYHVEKFNKMLS